MVQFKGRVNYGVAITGYVTKDVKYFDRTCPSCHGMYSSFDHTACPKCGAALTFIRMGDGKAMSISEITFNPALDKETKAAYEQGRLARKRSILIRYRFKMFSFADERGILSPHPLHKRMKEGAIVEIRTFNHPPYATPFVSEKYGPCVEMLYQIFSKYGDKVEVLEDAKIADATTPIRVDGQGKPAPMSDPIDPMAKLLAMQQEMAAKQTEMNNLIAQLGKAAPTSIPPVQNTAANAAAILDEDCPFDVDEMNEEAVSLFDDQAASVDPFSVK